jgi:hypothetical protein
LQLIPLQRINAATALASGSATGDGTLVAVTVSGAPAPSAAVSTSSPSGSQTAMQVVFQDAPRERLGVDQDHYFAGLVMAYSLLNGLVKMNELLREACRTFNYEEDSIGVVETELETLIYNVSETQQNTVRPLIYVFPLHDRYMSPSLRLFLYGDMVADPTTGAKRMLNTVPPFTWRHALPTGDGSLRLRGETPSADELKLRRKYHGFLVRLYSMILRSTLRVRMESTALFTPEYRNFIESTLRSVRPNAQSVAVLEARIRALIASLQLVRGMMFNTAQFYPASEELKAIIDPTIATVLSRYFYFQYATPGSQPSVQPPPPATQQPPRQG